MDRQRAAGAGAGVSNTDKRRQDDRQAAADARLEAETRAKLLSNGAGRRGENSGLPGITAADRKSVV